jgi:ATP-dependent Clp protease, protease subunit
MPKPLLLYNAIYDYSAERLVSLMTDIPDDEDIDMWVNSPGGSVFAGWAIIGAMQKRKGKKNMSVTGMAASMAAFMLLFADKREGLNVSQYLLHRADGYVENEEDQKFLDGINKDLRKQMEMRLNMDEFKNVTGYSMDELFDPKKRINVWLDSKQAKQIGLIDKIIKLEPKQAEAMNAQFVAFADFENPTQGAQSQRSEPEKPIENNTNNNQNRVKMTLAEIMAQHPELVAQIQTSAVTAERERVGAYMAFLDVDKENVVKAIKDGTAWNSAVMAEMTVKLTAHVGKTKLEADGGGEKPKTDAEILAEKTAKEKELETFEKDVEAKTKKSIA